MPIWCQPWFAILLTVFGAALLAAGWRLAVVARVSFRDTASPVVGKVIRVDRASSHEGGTHYTAVLQLPDESWAAEVGVPANVAKNLVTGDDLVVYRHPRKTGKYIHGERTMEIAHPGVVAVWGLGLIVFSFGLILAIQVTFYRPAFCA
jgi:hypothetical protein